MYEEVKDIAPEDNIYDGIQAVEVNNRHMNSGFRESTQLCPRFPFGLLGKLTRQRGFLRYEGEAIASF